MQGGGVPQDIADGGDRGACRRDPHRALLKAAGLAPSTSEAMRKLTERAVRVDGDVSTTASLLFKPGSEHPLQSASAVSRACGWLSQREAGHFARKRRCARAANSRGVREAKFLRRTPSKFESISLGCRPPFAAWSITTDAAGHSGSKTTPRRVMKVRAKVLTVAELDV